jgi:hypothetical protein
MPTDNNMIQRVPCARCGAETELHQLKNVRGFGVCTTCYREFKTCDICGEKHVARNLVSIAGINGTICKVCARQVEACPTCGKPGIKFSWYKNGVTDEKTKMCHACFEAINTRCHNCGCVQKPEHLVENLCGDCHAAHVNKIEDYSYKPKPIFHGEGRNKALINSLFLGTELEVQYTRKKRAELENSKKNTDKALYYHSADLIRLCGENTAYIKHDGSVSCGFEIVTHPGKMNFHTKLVSELFPWLKENQFCGGEYSSCGLHVHLDRSFFDAIPNGLYNFICFFEVNKQSIDRISRRSNSDFARYSGYSNDVLLAGINSETHRQNIIKSILNTHGKYAAVNLKHSTTVEIRTFKSTIDPMVYLGTLEFLMAAAYLCKYWDTKAIIESSWAAFMNFAHVTFGGLPNFESLNSCASVDNVSTDEDDEDDEDDDSEDEEDDNEGSF